jgi:molecular chaperone GrpE
VTPKRRGGPPDEVFEPEEQASSAQSDASDQTGTRAGGGALEALPAAEVLLAELEALRQEHEELKDRHLRLAAEFDNFRRRTRQEQDQVRALARADVVRSVLPTLDDLARWRDIPNDSTSVEALDEGLNLILKNLAKALEEHGVKRIEAREALFDPELHQGVLMAEAEGPEQDGTISRVFSEGYRLGDLLIRPAQVEVRSWEGPASPTEDETRKPGVDTAVEGDSAP